MYAFTLTGSPTTVPPSVSPKKNDKSPRKKSHKIVIIHSHPPKENTGTLRPEGPSLLKGISFGSNSTLTSAPLVIFERNDGGVGKGNKGEISRFRPLILGKNHCSITFERWVLTGQWRDEIPRSHTLCQLFFGCGSSNRGTLTWTHMRWWDNNRSYDKNRFRGGGSLLSIWRRLESYIDEESTHIENEVV
jgi:hypothetical protein